MQIYVMDTEVFAEQNIFDRVMSILPEERLKKIRSVKQEQGKKLSAAAGFLLLYGAFQQPDMMHIPGKERVLEAGLQSSLEYVIGERGKPSLFVNGKQLFYNLSHSKTKAACVIADAECGIDLERIDPGRVKDSFVRKVCTEREKEGIAQMEEEQGKKLFFKLWTGKESVMKCDGRGIAMGPDTIDVSGLLVKDNCQPEVSGKQGGCLEIKGLTLHALELEDYFLSVCCEKDTKTQLLVVDKAAVEEFLRGLDI